MANNVLYCQRCATPHQLDFPWIFWLGFRLDSSQCKGRLISSNADILKLEILAKEKNRKLAEKFQNEFSTEPIKKEKSENLDKYIFYKAKKIESSYLSGFYDLKAACPNCEEKVARSANICPNCKEYTKPHLKNFDYPTKKRNQEIALLLDQGIYTLQEVGNRFGFSRERARQIFKKMTGKPYDFRQEPVNITKHLDEWEKKQVKPAPRPNLGIYEAFFFRYKKLDQIALTWKE